jgi:hypothetical protein
MSVSKALTLLAIEAISGARKSEKSMKQQRAERTLQISSRFPLNWRPKLRRSISVLWASQDPKHPKQDGSALFLIYVIACLAALNLIVRFPGAAMTLDQINQMPLWGP